MMENNSIPTLRQLQLVAKEAKRGRLITVEQAAYYYHSKLYIITTPDDWPSKIGVSIDPWQRLKGIQTSHWLLLRVHTAFVIPRNYSKRQGANKIEREMLNELRHLALEGEWLDIKASELAERIRDRYNKDNV